MNEDQFRQACKFIVKTILKNGLGGEREHISLQYIGGEILTLPASYLRNVVAIAREEFGKIFNNVRDGAQSNLIANGKKVALLRELFGDRVGTSVENFGASRTVKGSAKKYKEIFRARRKEIEDDAPPISAVYVVDKEGIKYAHHEIKIASDKGYGITLRPVFHGGKLVNMSDNIELSEMFAQAFDRWILTSSIIIEPFHHLTKKRALRALGKSAGIECASGCPFQANCAEVSMDLEPNGDLYVCQDMADSGQYRIGNALRGTFDMTVWRLLKDRASNLPEDCMRCDYLPDCQGGCMSESIAVNGSPFGKTEHCMSWKTIFAKIDQAIQDNGARAVLDWVNELEEHQVNG